MPSISEITDVVEYSKFDFCSTVFQNKAGEGPAIGSFASQPPPPIAPPSASVSTSQLERGANYRGMQRVRKRCTVGVSKFTGYWSFVLKHMTNLGHCATMFILLGK